MKLLLLLFCLSFIHYASAQNTVFPTDVALSQKLLDLSFTAAERDSMLSTLQDRIKTYNYFHKNDLKNDAPFALSYSVVLPGMKIPKKQMPVHFSIPNNIALPPNNAVLAFYSIPQLASLIKNKKITSEKLTRIFIDRLKQHGNGLHCVTEITESLAIQQAKKADAEIASGNYRGPLHGIPYGIKDLFSVKGTTTTWGISPLKNNITDETAFVAKQLEKAGAVLIAKLSLGELAMDDVWFGGKTRNPWDTTKGSGGSSAGSASATAAGLVPFAIGTETYGSIVDPSMRCGVTGLRPTYGTVAKTGAMNLAWTSDKIGPICKSAEDAAIVYYYIHGADSGDASSIDVAFNYNDKIDYSTLKIAYAKNYIDTLPEKSTEKQTLAVVKKLGGTIEAIEFPDNLHGDEILGLIICAEAAAAFDPLTRSGTDDELVQQNKDRWPNIFRSARFIPAAEYINACRLRYKIMQTVSKIISKYDIIIAPPETGDQLAITNLTGNPSITIPNGFLQNGLPASITFIGKHFNEAILLAFANKYQKMTKHNEKHPPHYIK